MASNLEKLRELLRELFQLDQADLDFGIYRIMNQKRDDVVRFLDKDLLPQVQEAFKQYKSADKAVLQGELEKLAASVQNAGMNPDESPKVKEFRQRIAESAVDVTALENEVFSHLFSFFRRYYSEGDFLSLRRYKAGVYAIPYEGEEVKLHWANADQYYVKSSETFKDYTFKIQSGKRVRVHLVAASTEQDNNKAAPGKERRFVLTEEPLSEENGELFIRFEYRPSDGKEKQDDLNKQAIGAVLKTPGFEKWSNELGKLDPTPKNADRTVLEKHLTQYTARNTFDYFIHKDLGGFLRRELDFYIKNEVMHLDDIEYETAPKVEQYISQIKVIRSLAQKIIQFLEQLETFQKKLWLKKKFVIETNYCITLDHILDLGKDEKDVKTKKAMESLRDDLLAEIAKNNAQHKEWVVLFAIDEIRADLAGQVAYSKSLSVKFLRTNPHLVLDTKFFDQEFKDKLLACFDDIEKGCDGLLVHSENFQAPHLCLTKLAGGLSMLYADPPYNTGSDGFTYKDSFQHSTWLCMLSSRVGLFRKLLRHDGVLFVNLDDSELYRAVCLLGESFSTNGHLATFARRTKSGGGSAADGFAVEHDYVVAWAVDKDKCRQFFIRHDEEYLKRYSEKDADGRYFWDTMERSYTATKPYVIVAPDGTSLRGSWFRGEKRFKDDLSKGEARIVKLSNGSWSVQFKQRLAPGRKLRSLMHETDYKSQPEEISEMGLRDEVSYPKPVFLLGRLVETATFFDKATACVGDFFAGSGTTAHAIIKLNREDGGKRKYILVEMGDCFDTVLKPRIQKVVYSKDWNDGKPVSRDGVSHMIKYIRLESYDDALNNLELKRTKQQGTLLDADTKLREQYILSYMLDVESRGSQSLLNVEAFRNPDEYKLRVERNGETQLVNVDLIETFNWLLGLTVKHIDVIRGVRVVDGTNPDGHRVLILWRNIDALDNDALDKWFKKQDYNTLEMTYDLIYVNGDNNLENLRRADQTWKVRLIEEEFQRLMFDVQDV